MDSISNLSVLNGPSRSLTAIPLYKLFEKIATSATANDTATIFEDNGITRTYTYRELNSLTNRLARTIRQTILDKRLSRNNDGDFIVAVSMDPSDYLVITLLAIWKAGAAYLPLDPAFPQPRIDHILGEAKPALIIFDEGTRNFGNTFKLRLVEFLSPANGLPLNQDPLPEEERLQHLVDDLAIVLYTSGSTGVPKGVRLTHTSILNRLQWQFETFPYGKGETTAVFKTALTFGDSICEMWGPLLSGLALLVVPRATTKNPEELVRVLEKYRAVKSYTRGHWYRNTDIERLVLVPSLLRILLMYMNLRKSEKYLQNLKTWVCSGETLPVSLAKEFYKYFPANQHQLCNFYGSTEVMGDITFYILASLELHHQENVPIGTPLNNTIVYLLDNNLYPVQVGEVGELFICGSNLASGYVSGREPDKFIGNPFRADPMFGKLYRTGDFARIHNGILYYEGRTDSQVKIRGYRVDLSEIEKVLNEIEGVQKRVVLCYKSGEVDQAILAFVTADGSLTEEQIEGNLREKLVPYMVPQVVLIDEVPLLDNGKIDRQQLLKFYESFQVGLDYTGVLENQMVAAQVLFETIASLSGRFARFTININSNFYEIGGSSLNTIYTISKLSEAGYHISIHDFIMASNLGEILNKLSLEKCNLTPVPLRYIAESLQDRHKDIVIYMAENFYYKSPLRRLLLTESCEPDFKQSVDKVWEPLLELDLSFIVKTEKGKIVGVALNHDARQPWNSELCSRVTVVNECICNIEKPIMKQLAPRKGIALYGAWTATLPTLSPKENVSVSQFIEAETLRLAKSRGFTGVIATNVNPLTQQLATDIFGFTTCIDYQLNQFVARDKTKPFAMAPDSQRILVQWKAV